MHHSTLRMPLVNSLTLPWDAAILVMMTGFLGSTIGSVVWLNREKRRSIIQKIGVAFVGIVFGFLFLLVAYGSIIEPRIISITRERIPFPIHQTLTIAVLSDFHVGPYKKASFLRRVVTKVNKLQPDIVLLVGDFVLTHEVTPEALVALGPLKKLQAPLGIFAVLGNHDHGIYRLFQNQSHGIDHSDLVRDELQGFGITVLSNASKTLDIGNARMAIAGMEDALSGSADIEQTFASIPSEIPVILLSHNPDIILDPLARTSDLIVSGHTHGGQIRLPRIGPVSALPTRIGRKYDQGIFQLENGGTLAITRGIGESGPRARLFAPPEILLLELSPQ